MHVSVHKAQQFPERGALHQASHSSHFQLWDHILSRKPRAVRCTLTAPVQNVFTSPEYLWCEDSYKTYSSVDATSTFNPTASIRSTNVSRHIQNIYLHYQCWFVTTANCCTGSVQTNEAMSKKQTRKAENDRNSTTTKARGWNRHLPVNPLFALPSLIWSSLSWLISFYLTCQKHICVYPRSSRVNRS